MMTERESLKFLREDFPRASLNAQEQQDRPTNNEVRQKQKQSNETNQIMVSEPTVYEVNEHLNTISVNQVIEMSVQEADDENMSVH